MSRRRLLFGLSLALFFVPACDHGSIVGSCLGLGNYTNCRGGALDVDVPCDGGGGAGGSPASGGGPSVGGGGTSSGGGGGAGGCEPGKLYPCYDGPANTEDAGICHGGKKMCKSDGLSYGPCTKEQKPKSEDFDTPGDENCDGVPSADENFVLPMVPSAYVSNVAVAVDAKANVYTATVFAGSFQLGSSQLLSNGGTAVALAKLDSTGAVKFANQLGTQGSLGIGASADGHFAVAGGSNFATDFGDGPVPAGIQLASYDTDGKLVFSAGCTATPGPNVDMVAVAPNGDVVIAGLFTGNANCGTMDHAAGTKQHVLVASFKADGTPHWERAYGNTTSDMRLGGLAVDGSGNVWLTGDMAGTVNTASNTLVDTGGGAIFVLSLDAQGNERYAKAFGDATAQTGASISANATGSVVISGDNAGSVDFGCGAVAAGTFLAELNGLGECKWSLPFGTHNMQAVLFDDGRVATTGTYSGALDLGFGTMTPTAGNDDVFVAVLDPKGTPMWAKGYGGAASHNVESSYETLSLSPPREVSGIAVGGKFRGTLDLGRGPIAAHIDGGGFIFDVAP